MVEKAMKLLIGMGFIVPLIYILYIQTQIETIHREDAELERLMARHGECGWVIDESRRNDSFGGLTRIPCPTERMEELVSRGPFDQIEGLREDQLIASVYLVGVPITMWLVSLLWTRALVPGAKRGAELGKEAARKSGAAAKRSLDDPNGALSGLARASDSLKGRTRECPDCAEMIKPQAKVCRHCGAKIEPIV